MVSRVVGKTHEEELLIETTELGLNVVLRGVVAEVELRHCVHNNSSDKNVEARYELAVGAYAAVHALEAELADGKRVMGRLTRADAAQAQYDDAIAQGSSAALLEAEPSARELIALSLGSIPPRGTVTCVVCYTAQVMLNSSGLSVHFPSIESRSQLTIPSLKLHVAADSLPGTVKSVTWALDGVVLGQGSTQLANIDIKKPLMLRAELESVPAYGAYHEESTGAVVAWCLASKTQATRRSPIDATFIVDRSGSMRGDKMQCAREALLLLVGSLPIGSRFNAIGFGSSVDTLFANQSEELNDETLARARSWITGIDSNLGGTELLLPLAVAITQRKKVGTTTRPLPHIVIVMTDGRVESNAQVLAFVRDNSGAHTSTRVFVLGIGKDVDTALIEGVAKAGAGAAAFVEGAEQIKPAVMGFMQRSTLGLLPFPEVTIITNGHSTVSAHPRSGLLFAEETALLFAFVGKDITAGTMTVRFATSEQKEMQPTPLPEIESTKGVVGRMAAVAAITDLLLDNATEEAVRLSLEHTVLCRLTAFVAILPREGEAASSALATVAFPAGADAAAIAERASHIHSQARKKHRHCRGGQSVLRFARLEAARTVMVGGIPCAVTSSSTSKTGKHGSAKAFVSAVDPFTGKKVEVMMPLAQFEEGGEQQQQDATVPVADRRRYMLTAIDSDLGHVEVLDDSCKQKTLVVSDLLRGSSRLRELEQGRVLDDIAVVSLVVGEREEAISLVEKASAAPEVITGSSTARTAAAPTTPEGWETMGAVARLAFLQSADGHWANSSLLCETLGIAAARLTSAAPAEFAMLPSELWITTVVLAYLEAKQPNTKLEWLLLAEKGADWLSLQSITLSKIEAMRAAANAFVNQF